MSHLEPTKFTWVNKNGVPRKKPVAGARWKARYRDASGRARSETFDRKADAEKFLERVGADLQRGDWVDPALRRMKFDEWANEWRSSGLIHLRPSTARSYRYVLDRRVLPYFSGRPVASIDRAEVKRFIASAINAGRSVKTVREYLNVLSLVLQCALEAGAIKENSAARHKLPTRPKPESVVLTLAQVEALAAEIRAPYDTLVRLAAQTGLRPGELCGLRVGRVDLLNRRITVAETVQPIYGELVHGPTKSNSTRVIGMPPSIAAELARVLAGRREVLGRNLRPSDFVFESLNGDEGPLNRDSFRKWVLLPALRRAGLPEEYRTHDLRHTHASMLIELGAHPKAVSDRLGHSDIGVTMNVYGHLFPSVEEEIVDRLEELGRRAAAAPWQPAKVVGLDTSGRVQDADRTRQDAKQRSTTDSRGTRTKGR
ncbi:MAG: tyrosine-type recombinase/integrase [Acidimicrobiales bacterium]